MRIVVTGGAGFIGAHSSRLLLSRGHEVVVIDDLSHGTREAVPRGASLHVLDVRAPEVADVLRVEHPDAILHLAAQMDVRKSVADPVADASINVLGTVNLLAAAEHASVRRFVFASSGGAVYGEQYAFPAPESHPCRPTSPYGVSKLCGEAYVRLRSRHSSSLALRYANVYGPGQDPHGEAGVVAIFCARMVAGEPPLVRGDGLQTRDYVHVEDVAWANVLALEGHAQGELNIGTGRETSVLELARLLADALSCRVQPRHIDPAPGEQRRSAVDPGAAKSSLGWEPRIELAAGLATTAAWFQTKAADGGGHG